jgi:UDP-3-O-[3-hydroxymyristoyl] glucosamine N-acyltransferase
VKLTDIAERLNCTLQGDGQLEITGVVGIDDADSGHLTFVSNPKYAAKAKNTKAAAVIVANDFPEIGPATLRSSNPYLTFAQAVELFYQPPQPSRSIDPAARVAASAKIGEGASIAPYVVIEDDVQIGKNCTLYPFVHIARGARIGDNFKAYANVSVREFCVIGNGVILQDGVRIGTDGYGYAKKADGSYYKIVQSGIVVLEDDVEVGANSTIDPTWREDR